MDAAHPLGVEPGQVVVDRDEVDALAAEPVEVDRQRGDEGLALAGLHLGDPAEVQRGAAHQLHVEVALADHPAGRLAGDGERLDQQIVERGAVGEALAELVGLGLQLLVGERSISDSSALMSGTRPSSALSFLPSPARRMRSRMPMRRSSLPASLPARPVARGPYGAAAPSLADSAGVGDRLIDAVIFDLGGVLARNGRPSDFAKRYPDHDPVTLTTLLMGDYGADTDHPWHRLERGEITLAENREHNRRALAGIGIEMPLDRRRRRRRPRAPRSASRSTPRWSSWSPSCARWHRGCKLGVLTNNVREFRPRGGRCCRSGVVRRRGRQPRGRAAQAQPGDLRAGPAAAWTCRPSGRRSSTTWPPT